MAPIAARKAAPSTEKAKRTKAHRPSRQVKNTAKHNEKGQRIKATATDNDLATNSSNHRKELFPPNDGTTSNSKAHSDTRAYENITANPTTEDQTTIEREGNQGKQYQENRTDRYNERTKDRQESSEGTSGTATNFSTNSSINNEKSMEKQGT
jgi:hypothetical protein